MVAPHQHNGHDCGLYMLRYIDLLATHQPALGERKRKRDATLRWRDFPELSFCASDIDGFRVGMRRTIERAGASQRAAKVARERSMRSSRQL